MATSTQSTVTRQTSQPLTAAVTYTAFSFFDIVLLRLTDLFLWSSPQLTLLLAGFYCFGGKLGGRQDPWLKSWAGVVFLAVSIAVPITALQRHRRDAPISNRRRTQRRKHKLVNFSALREDDQYRLERIARGMNALGALVSQQINTSEDDDVAEAKDSESSLRGVATAFVTYLRAHMLLLAVGCAMTSVLALAPRRASLSHLFDLCLAPLCLAWLCVAGLIMAVVEPLQEAAAYRARSRALPKRASRDNNEGGDARNGETAARAARAEVEEEEEEENCDGVLTVSPHCVEQALRLRRLQAHPHLRGGGGATARYALPALSEKEAAALQQLLNFGAPFSTVLLKPLRLWNARTTVMAGAQGTAEDSPRHSRGASVRTGSVGDLGQCRVGHDAWHVAWERDGLRCEVKHTPIAPEAAGGASPEPTIVTAMRLLVNVRRANVGSLQAILLDDPDGFLDAKKESFAYYWDPLLVERKVLKQLSYDVSVVRTVSRSAVHGVAPTEMTQIASSAVLLDYEQQTALKLYRPFGRHRKGKKLVSSATRGLRVFVSCAVPCPAALREPPSSQKSQQPATQSIDLTSLTIGMEEADGSLSLGMLFSLNSAAEAMAYPANWVDVLQRDATHRMERLASLVRTVGPQENEVAVYKNERGFQPLLLRQAFSERVKPDGAAAESVAATVAAAESADWLETPTKASRASRRDKTDPASPSSSPPSEGLAEVSLRFVSDLIAQPVWKPVKVRGGTQIFSASTSTNMASGKTGEDAMTRARGELLSAARAVKVRLFLPRATLPIVDDVLRRAELAPVYDAFVEQRVTLTALQAAELLSMAVPDLVADDYDSGIGIARSTADAAADDTQGVAASASPRHATSLAEVTAKMAEARSRGQLIQWVRHRPPALGGLGALCLSPRDYVQRVTAGEYFTAADLFSTGHGSHGLDAAVQGKLPSAYRQLPPATRMFLRCGEDASDVLPPLEGVYRGHVRLAGVLCWETTAGAAATAMQSAMTTPADSTNSTAGVAMGGLEDVDAQEKGVMLVRCVVVEPGGWMPSWLWNRSLEDELDNADQLRKLVADAVADRSVV